MPVLDNITLHVHEGEVVALLGANGAGKTTLLLTVAGELRPTEGHIELFGTPTASPLHVRSRMGLGFVPEERSVIPSLSVQDNLKLGPGGVSPALDLFPELKALLKRKAGLLSGGEQQILTLARALASAPRLLLADEVSMGLAPLVVERLLEAIRLAAERGVAVILVEQHMRAALSVADRAYVLRRGEVVLEGRADWLLEHAADIEGTYLSTVQLESPNS
jgi:branched-chain amino acid transport system ATP-binding protein